jgi:hypothetical protein
MPKAGTRASLVRCPLQYYLRTVRNWSSVMPQLTRRGFVLSALAAGGLRAVPAVALRQKRVLTLVYDKSIGAMRAIDRIVP